MLKNWITKNSISILALLVSSSSVYYTRTQYIESKSYNELLIRPYLTVHKTSSSVVLKNEGLGPALITRIILVYKSKPYCLNAKNLSNILSSLDANFDKDKYAFSFIDKNEPITKDGDIKLIYCKSKSLCNGDSILNSEQIKIFVSYEDFYHNIIENHEKYKISCSGL